MSKFSAKTLFELKLSDDIQAGQALTREVAEKLFEFFRDSPVFRWSDAHNDCEDRANAICILLDHWHVPNYKGWVFNGPLLKKGFGSLRNSWKFHVAPLVPVQAEANINFYVIDPAVLHQLATLEDWADLVTDTPFTYHLIKDGSFYIFPAGRIRADNWNKRNHQNYKWTIQGLGGINGLSPAGKAYLCFNKKKVRRTEERFNDLKHLRPQFLKDV